MRADLVTARAARAHAAWQGRTEVDPRRRPRRRAAGPAAPPPPQPVRRARDGRGPARRAARRRRAGPRPRSRGGRRSRGRAGRGPVTDPRPTTSRHPTTHRHPRPTGRPGDDPAARPAAPSRPARSPSRQPSRSSRRTPTRAGCRNPAGSHRADDPYRARLLQVRGSATARPVGAAERSPAWGRTVGSSRRGAGRIHLPATIPAAAPHQERAAGRRSRPARHGRPAARVPEGREANLVLSASTPPARWAPASGWPQVKTAVLSLLVDAYQRRDKVGLVTFRGDGRRPWPCRRRPRSRPPPAACRPPARRPNPAGRGTAQGGRRPAGSSGSATRAGGRCSSSSPTAAPRPAPTRSPGPRRVAGRCAPTGVDSGGHRLRVRPLPPGSGRATWPSTSAPNTCPLDDVGADDHSSRATSAHGRPPDAAGPARRPPRRRPHHPAAAQPAARHRPHRRRQGQVDRRLRAGPARLEPGLVDRRVPVRQVRQVADRRADRAGGPRRAARQTGAGRPGGVAQDGLRLVLVAQGRHRGRPRRGRRRGLGRDQAPARRRDARRCTSSTSSPTRCDGAGSTSTTSSRPCATARATSTSSSPDGAPTPGWSTSPTSSPR